METILLIAFRAMLSKKDNVCIGFGSYTLRKECGRIMLAKRLYRSAQGNYTLYGIWELSGFRAHYSESWKSIIFNSYFY